MVEGQEPAEADLGVLQSLQPFRRVQADMGNKRPRRKIHLDGAWLTQTSKICNRDWESGTQDEEGRS